MRFPNWSDFAQNRIELIKRKTVRRQLGESIVESGEIQTDTQTDRQTDILTERHTYRQYIDRRVEAYRQRQTQTDTQTHRHRDNRTDIHICEVTKRHPHRHTVTHSYI